MPDGAIIYTRNETNWSNSANLDVTKNGFSVNVWIQNTTRGKNWAQSTIPLSAGRYKFSNNSGQIRIDSDWYIHIPNTNTIPPI